jgi:hypothetical protein
VATPAAVISAYDFNRLGCQKALGVAFEAKGVFRRVSNRFRKSPAFGIPEAEFLTISLEGL